MNTLSKKQILVLLVKNSNWIVYLWPGMKEEQSDFYGAEDIHWKIND